jgi:ubiquitin-protein ligase
MAFARSIKRIMNDVNELRKEPIDGVGIYQCEDNLKHIYVVIAGPKDSAYQDGLYFFEFYFPDDYPHNPPKGKFLNWQNSIVRMHPNMYIDGKLCFSFLGTWEGPSWTSAMSLTTIILGIQSIMDDNPLKNEPGYEKNCDSAEHNKYKRVVQYYNYRDFIAKSLESIYKSGEIIKEHNSYVSYFRQFIIDYYLKNRLVITSQLEKLLDLYPTRTNLSTAYQSTTAVLNYPDLSVEIKKKLELMTGSL